MSYQAFALKYRPQTFDEVIGQEHVVSSLKSAIQNNRVHHAYLFCGPRGVGKTSLARILAKSLNCVQGPTVTPCGKCPSCVDIGKGTSLDIIEIDGASNRGIDEIRTLRENVKLAPAHAPFKIYIIDEVHMLTQEAFNALLKTLEEPPAHVKFIFATTHPQKVLPTILSRCQKFQFNLIPIEKIVEKMQTILKQENISIEVPLLYAIARAAGGSIRDAESLVDQIAPLALDKGTIEDVLSFLGIIDEESLNYMLAALVSKEVNKALEFIAQLIEDGKDLSIFLTALIEHFRLLLLAKVSPKTFLRLVDVSPHTKEALQQQTQYITSQQLLQFIEQLLAAKEQGQRLNLVRIPLELVIIKFGHVFGEEAVSVPLKAAPDQPAPSNKPAPQIVKTDTNKSAGPAATGRPVIRTFADFEKSLDDELADLDTVAQALPEEQQQRQDDQESEILSDGIMAMQVRKQWGRIIGQLQKKRAALAAHLSFAKPITSAGKVVTIAFSPSDSFHKEVLEAIKNVKAVEEVIEAVLQKKVGIKFEFNDVEVEPVCLPPQATASQSKEAEEQQEQPVLVSQDIDSNEQQDDNEFIEDLLDTFGGKLHTEE